MTQQRKKSTCKVIVTILLPISIFCFITGYISAATDNYGHTLYRSQQGAPDGFPGCFPGKKPVIDKKTGKPVLDEKTGKPVMKAIYPQWGQPELENYPGSVEHFRTHFIKYLPAINTFNQTSLIKNFKLCEQAGVKTEQFKEPIYYMPMYGLPQFTGKFRDALSVFRLKKDGTNHINLNLGKLNRGMYAVRVIAALPELTKNFKAMPAHLVMRCVLKDAAGKRRSWTRQILAADEFYGVAEYYFNVPKAHAFSVDFSLDPESDSDLLVYNVDLHNALAGCPEKAIKRASTYYSTEKRKKAQAIQKDKRHGLWKGKVLQGEARVKRDAYLWESLPPDFMNLAALYYPMGYTHFPVPANLSKKELGKIGVWECSREKRGKLHTWPLINKKLGLSYSKADFLASRPLPDPYPYKDRGWGIYIKDNGFISPIRKALGKLAADTLWKLARSSQWAESDKAGKIALRYFERGDLNAARDASILLCRQVYAAPSYITYYKRTARFLRRHHSSNRPGLRRLYSGYIATRLKALAFNYDCLFDFINGNEELASAVSRYIPWIKNSRDLSAFLDSRLLYLPAREMINHNLFDSVHTPTMALQLAILMDNPEASKPLMEYLFSQTFMYPLPTSGIQDYMQTADTRDGTSTRGSFFYDGGGSAFLKPVELSAEYIKRGGFKRFDLSDRKRFPKPITGLYFPIEARVAGLWQPGIGDVNFISYAHGVKSCGDIYRAGWRHTKDPKFAYIIKNGFGRKEESNQTWAALLKAAKGARNPFMANRSRALACWAGILEAGTDQDDDRFRLAVTVRTGVGWGHSHRDTLDLQITAMGCQMTPDGGGRPGYGNPSCEASKIHNVVEIDRQNWEGHAWTTGIADMEGSRMMHIRGIPTPNLKGVKRIERTVALIDVDPGRPTNRILKHGLIEEYGKDIILPKRYVFDVFRVSGGKCHTYCFHGAPGGALKLNAINPHQVPAYDKAKNPDDKDAKYLSDYIIAADKGSGEAPDTVLADWKLGRKPFEFTANRGGSEKNYRAPAPEQQMRGATYDPGSPRKHIRLHLLEQKGAKLLWGRWVSAPYTHVGKGFGYGMQFMNLHVMHDGQNDRESVFTAIIETYAGEKPAVDSVVTLPVTPAETGAFRPVAVKVITTNGHQDLLFADGDPGTLRTIQTGTEAMRAKGRYAYISTDGNGLRQASLAGGTEVALSGTVALKASLPAYKGNILSLDYYKREIGLDIKLPKGLIGNSFWDVGNKDHGTSLQVLKTKGRKLFFRKGLEIVSTRVRSVDEKKGIVTGKLVSILMGASEDNGLKPGMTKGLWASNEDLSSWWRCEYLGGTRKEGYRYRLTGNKKVTSADFPVNGAIRIFELEVGDHARLETFVSLRRIQSAPVLYLLQANTACSISLPKQDAPGGYEISVDKHNWAALSSVDNKKMCEIKMTTEQLGTGKIFLRPQNAGL